VHEVFCRARPPDNFVYVDGGRGDDLLSARCRTPGVDISGGPGADRLISNGCGAALSGEPGNDVLVGDRWPQVLRGGGGDDRLFGRAGDDLLYGDGSAKRSGDDAIDGGPGRDTAAWDERSSGIRADLGRGFERSEDYDTLRGVENLVGTREDDVLIGNGGRNRLRGGNGTDLLDGRGGDDLLDGGYGSLIYSDVDDDDPDRFRCGGGRDVVRFPGPVVLPLGCELMRDDYPLEFGTLRVRPRAVGAHAVQVQVVCDTSRSVCRRRVVISAGGRELGRTALVTDPPEVMRVDLKRAAPRDGVVNIVVEGDDGDPDADPEDGPVPYRFKWRIACTGAPRRDVCRVGG
jgi:hypothetical protein